MFEDFPSEFGPAMRHVLWRHDASDGLANAYHWLNVCEAVAWFGIAAYVSARFLRHRRSFVLEPLYIALFLVFGLSDVWESQVVPVWLVAAKGLIFAGIVAVRVPVVKRLYPGSSF